jgi:GAF domain-containing protein
VRLKEIGSLPAGGARRLSFLLLEHLLKHVPCQSTSCQKPRKGQDPHERSSEVYHLRDAVDDVRSMTNPLVAGSLGLRFYAVAPLRTHDGFNPGTLCVIGYSPAIFRLVRRKC